MFTKRSRSRLHLCVVAIALIVSQAGPTANRSTVSAGEKRPVTLDDLLRQQDFGQAMVDSKAHLIVFEQTPSYDHLGDYSIHWSTRFPLPNFGLIMAINLKAGTAPKLLFEPEPGTLYRLQSF